MFGKNVVATIRVDSLPDGAERVVVTPFDSFGNKGRAISTAIPI